MAMKVRIQKFQREFMAAVEDERYDVVAMSAPRGAGKSYIGAKLLERCLTPGDSLHIPGKEYILTSSTLGQSHQAFGFLKPAFARRGEGRRIQHHRYIGPDGSQTPSKPNDIAGDE